MKHVFRPPRFVWFIFHYANFYYFYICIFRSSYKVSLKKIIIFRKSIYLHLESSVPFDFPMCNNTDLSHNREPSHSVLVLLALDIVRILIHYYTNI